MTAPPLSKAGGADDLPGFTEYRTLDYIKTDEQLRLYVEEQVRLAVESDRARRQVTLTDEQIEEVFTRLRYDAGYASHRELAEAIVRCVNTDLDALLTQILVRRVKIAKQLLDMAAGKVQMPDAAKLREMAVYLGTPTAPPLRVAVPKAPST